MSGNNGIHHLAIATKDIKGQIEFFNDVLGTELVALYWMHGVEGAWHGFMKLNDRCYIAFVETPDIAGIERTIGVTHAGNAGNPCAGGAMQHVALNVDTIDDLLAMRDRIRSRGITVFGPLDHGMCHSIYFAGPEDLSLEVATSAKPIDARAWIDPDVVELAGISDEELGRFRNPRPLRRDGAGPAARARHLQAVSAGLPRGGVRAFGVDPRRGRHRQVQREHPTRRRPRRRFRGRRLSVYSPAADPGVG